MNSLPYELIQYIYSFMDAKSVLRLCLASKALYENAPKWILKHRQLMAPCITAINSVGYQYTFNDVTGTYASARKTSTGVCAIYYTRQGELRIIPAKYIGFIKHSDQGLRFVYYDFNVWEILHQYKWHDRIIIMKSVDTTSFVYGLP